MKLQEIELETEIETELETTIILTPKVEIALWQIKNDVFQNDTPNSWVKNLANRLKFSSLSK